MTYVVGILGITFFNLALPEIPAKYEVFVWSVYYVHSLQKSHRTRAVECLKQITRIRLILLHKEYIW